MEKIRFSIPLKGNQYGLNAYQALYDLAGALQRAGGDDVNINVVKEKPEIAFHVPDCRHLFRCMVQLWKASDQVRIARFRWRRVA